MNRAVPSCDDLLSGGLLLGCTFPLLGFNWSQSPDHRSSEYALSPGYRPQVTRRTIKASRDTRQRRAGGLSDFLLPARHRLAAVLDLAFRIRLLIVWQG